MQRGKKACQFWWNANIWFKAHKHEWANKGSLIFILSIWLKIISKSQSLGVYKKAFTHDPYIWQRMDGFLYTKPSNWLICIFWWIFVKWIWHKWKISIIHVVYVFGGAVRCHWTLNAIETSNENRTKAMIKEDASKFVCCLYCCFFYAWYNGDRNAVELFAVRCIYCVCFCTKSDLWWLYLYDVYVQYTSSIIWVGINF